MIQPEVKLLLKQQYQSLHSPPNQKVIELQRKMLCVLGYEADFAVSQLNLISSKYDESSDVVLKMQYFMMSASIATRY